MSPLWRANRVSLLCWRKKWWIVGCLNLAGLACGAAESPNRGEEKNEAPGPEIPRGRALAPIQPGAGGQPGVPGKSTSASGQFVVVADELRVRATVARMCEEVKRRLLGLLGMKDDWQTPMVVIVRGGRPQVGTEDFRVRMRRLKGGEFHLQMEMWVHDRFRQQRFQEELLRLLLAEVILREVGQRQLPAGRSLLPGWLHLGISETITYRARGFPSTLFASVYRAGSQLSVEEILRMEPEGLDRVSQEVYKASACGMVQALLDQPGGSENLRKYLRAMPRSDADPWDLLAEFFPQLVEPESLDKWWALQMTNLSRPTPFESMGAGETNQRLERILQVMVKIDPSTGERPGPENDKNKRSGFRIPLLHRLLPGGNKDETDAGEEKAPEPQMVWGSIPIEAWQDQLRPDELEELLQPILRKLEGLAMRSHPLFQSLITDYRELITAFGSGSKVRDWQERVDRLEAERVALVNRCREVETYMDWWMANHWDVRSGAFDDFLEAADRLDAELSARDDEVSRYLDRLSEEFR